MRGYLALLVALAVFAFGGLACSTDEETSNGDTTLGDTGGDSTNVDGSGGGDLLPEWTSCATADDCVLVEVGCCDHCNGGRLVSVNAASSDAAAAAVQETDCQRASCTEIGCSPKYATCDSGVCGSTEELPSPCAGLDEASCLGDAACAPLMGAPADEVCSGDNTNWMSVYAGCGDAAMGCGEAETCGADPASGQPLIFPDTCLPSGWTACGGGGCDVPAACPLGAPLDAGQVCARPGETAGSVVFTVMPMGCHSSSCTVRRLAICSASVSDATISLDALFCIDDGTDPNMGCTADCSGGGFARCGAGELADGTYTATIGDISLEFTLPLDPAGVCGGDPFGG